MGDAADVLGLAAEFSAALLVYFLPTVVATWRRAERRSTVYVVNLLGGWTVIGWVAALVLAVVPTEGDRTPRRRRPQLPPEWLEE